mgnify:CR=1 FL=1
MIIIPFIFFLLLTIYWWHKHQCFDVCVYMSALYAFTSLMCIIVVEGRMLDDAGVQFDEYDLKLSVLPTMVYLASITIGMLPFSMLYKNDLKSIKATNPWILDGVCWVLIAVSMLNLYLVADSTMEILSGDLSSVRTDHYNGIESPAQVKAQSLPSIVGYFYYLNISTLLALPLFFYYVCFEKRPWWFYALLFFASLSMPIMGVQSVDRTEIMFYGMMFISCYIVFRKFLSRTVKRVFCIASVPLLLVVGVYLYAVTDSRFSERENGMGGGVAQYAGQNYLNFCFFWEHGNWEEVTTERILPLHSHFVMHIDNDNERRDVRSGKLGFFMSVFAAYVGDILLDLSPIGLALWVVMFFTVTALVLRRSHREELTAGEYLAFFFLSVIPIFGVFYYRYMAFGYSLMAIIVAFVFFTEKYRIVMKIDEPKEEEG